MSSADVTIYSTAFCGWCERVKALLKRKGIDFREIRVDEEPAARQEMIARSGRRTVPQIFIGTRFVGGFEQLYALERSGELDSLTAQTI